MVKFVHCADLHLGSSFSAFDRTRVSVLRKGLEDSFNAMIDFCVNMGADILLLSGDIFDTPSPASHILHIFEEGINRLENTSVFAALGNHDCGAILPKAKNLHVFSTEPEKVFLPQLGLSVWGQSFSTENPPSMTGLFEKKDGVNILCVHGNLNAEGYNPITTRQLENSGYIYAALGHKHSFISQACGRCTACYSGSLVGRGFDETGEKGFVYGLAEGAEVKLKFIPSGAARFEEAVLRLSADEENDIKAFESTLEENVLYRIKLSEGTVSPEYLRRRLEDNVYYVEVVRRGEAEGPFFDLLREALKDDPSALRLAVDALMGRRDLF